MRHGDTRPLQRKFEFAPLPFCWLPCQHSQVGRDIECPLLESKVQLFTTDGALQKLIGRADSGDTGFAKPNRQQIDHGWTSVEVQLKTPCRPVDHQHIVNDNLIEHEVRSQRRGASNSTHNTTIATAKARE
jgi:hypothetical protein